MKQGLGTEADAGSARQTGEGAPQPTPAALAEVARLFPQLEILELIGQGGMGTVYKARQTGLDRIVALKILSPGLGKDPAFAERFAREAKALALLNHPGVVTIYDFGQVQGLYFFLMEFVDGANLRQLLQQGELPPEQAFAIVPRICEALQFAHQHGIMHRDIKPENILVDRHGRVKIADFGLVKLLGGEVRDRAITSTGMSMGTPNYMAPEQIENAKAVDHRADIYSLGVVFYEILTGELPLGRFAPPSQKVQVDVRLDEVVLRSLEKDPARRYQQAIEVKSDLDCIAAQAPPAREKSLSAKLGLNLELERVFEADLQPADFARRLKEWTEAAGFACLRDSPRRWAFRRGSHLAAVYTFKIGKIPTELEVSLEPGTPVNARCFWRTFSPLTVPTARDVDRVAKELDSLVAHLKPGRK